MKKIRRVLTAVLVFMLAASMLAAAAISEKPSVFYRRDKKVSESTMGKPDNLRLVTGETGELYKFRKPSSGYGIPSGFVPTDEGLSTLNISGSAQFNIPQFRYLANAIREVSGDRTVYVLDLRQESHGFINEGIVLSRYAEHNWANLGMTLEQVLEDENQRFPAMVGNTVTAYSGTNPKASNRKIYQVENVMSEKELVESEGFVYVRIAVPDHHWPSDEQVDFFINLIKENNINPETSWLHFHCLAGMGRTGIFMTIYDMMQNPDLPMLDLVVRHTMMGGGYPLRVMKDENNYQKACYDEKNLKMPLLYEYIRENRSTNYEVSWSQWLRSKGI